MRSYVVQLEGVTPLMMHRDNLEFKAIVERWQRDPANREKSVPGDDRSPAWSWIGSLYNDGAVVALPTDCVMACCMGAGAEVRASRGKKSLKAQTQSGMSFAEPFLKFVVNGGQPIRMADLQALHQEDAFDQHQATARELGFALDIRRVPIGASRHVRVRPVFEHWRAQGTLNVWDEVLTATVLNTVFYLGGQKYGLCEWRPSGRRPGPFGRFRAEIKAEK